MDQTDDKQQQMNIVESDWVEWRVEHTYMVKSMEKLKRKVKSKLCKV